MKIIALLTSVSILAGCASAPLYKDVGPLEFLQQYSWPEVGAQTARPGELIFKNGDEYKSLSIRFRDEYVLERTTAVRPKHYVKAGAQSSRSAIFFHNKKGKEFQCFEVEVHWDFHANWLGQSPGSGNYPFCRSSETAVMNPLMFLDMYVGIAFLGMTPGDEEVEVEFIDQPAPDSSTMIKELYYDGSNNGHLRFTYKEYSGDYSRPAFVREFLHPETAKTFSFNGIRIDIMQADNSSLTYQVLE